MPLDRFESSVAEALSRHRMAPRGTRILVAFSAGPDSTALLAALVNLRAQCGIEVEAAHLHHGLRGEEGDADLELAQEICLKLRVVCTTARLPPGGLAGRRGGIEQAARVERYAFLQRTARSRGCERIATAHHRDDQLETVLMRLLRGARAPGLAGIQRVRDDGVIRPLLDLGRADVMAYLERRRLPFAVDSSNADLRLTRNRIRNQVLPALEDANPNVRDTLLRLGDAARQLAITQENVARAYLRAARLENGGLLGARLNDVDEDCRRLVARAWLRAERGSLRRIGHRHLDALARCLVAGGTVALPEGARVANRSGVLHFEARPSVVDEGDANLAGGVVALPEAGKSVRFGPWDVDSRITEEPAPLPDGLDTAVLDRDRIEGALTIRAWCQGDRLRPLGGPGSRKLSDIFIDRKVPRLERALLPIVMAGSTIVWVPGVVRGDTALVTPATRRTLVVRASRRRAEG